MSFDLSRLDELNSVINASGINDKRRRNQEIQRGLMDPTGFSKDYSATISDFNTQTNLFSDQFSGAGRKLGSNQDWDVQNPDLVKLFGSTTQRLDDGLYYYGDKDPTQSSWFDYKNPGQYTTKDVSPGKYEIFNGDNTSLGYGYKSWADSIKELGMKNAQKYIKYRAGTTIPESYDEYGNIIPASNIASGYYFTGPQQTWNNIDWGGGGGGWSQQGGYGYTETDKSPWTQSYSTQDDVIKALDKAGYFNVDSKGFYGSPNSLSDLVGAEVYAQMLAGKLPYAVDSTSWRDFGNNRKTNSLSGENAMFGSLPLLFNDKLLGYKDTISPASNGHGFVNDVTQQILDTNSKTQSNATLSRVYDTDSFKDYATKLDDKNIFINPEGVSKFGFKQPESYQFEQQDDDGFLGGLGGLLGTVLSFTPLAPLGYGLSTISALESGNPLGAVMSIAGMAGIGLGDLFGPSGSIMEGIDDVGQLGYGGSLGGLGGTELGNALSKVSDFTGINPSSLMSGGAGALNALVKGGNPLTAGLTSGLADIFGRSVGQATQSQGLGKLAGFGAGAGLSSLFNKRGVQAGQEGLNSFMMTNPQINNAAQAKTPEQMQMEEEMQRRSEEQQRLQRIQEQQTLGRLYGNS